MNSTDFWNLCIEQCDSLFPEFDAICLNCGNRIGAHAQEEFERCSEDYFGVEYHRE
mgnify:CR=1 FL=1